MNRIFLFIVFCGLLSTPEIIGETIANKSCDTAKKIDLKGNFPAAKSRSLVEPIQAFVTNQSSIEVDFHSSLLGTIVLSIYDKAGNVVFQQSVDTNEERLLLIDITSFDAGEYTIEFINSQTDLSGEFEI